MAAFERGAVDYVLKPIQEDRLQTTIERLKERIEPTTRRADAAGQYVAADRDAQARDAFRR